MRNDDEISKANKSTQMIQQKLMLLSRIRK